MLAKHPRSTHMEVLEIITGLSQAIRCCSQDRVFCEDVTFHQFVILNAVAKKGELLLADLHTILSVEKSTTTRLMNPLIRKCLVKRERSRHDSRAIKLTLTDQGRETHRKVWICLTDYFGNVVRNIPERNRDEVLESVRIFVTALKNYSTDCCCSG